jgi:hypothetical protein
MKWTNIIVLAPVLATMGACIDGPVSSKDPIETGILDTDPTDTDATDTDATDTDVVDISPTWDDVGLSSWSDTVTCVDDQLTLVMSTLNWGYDAELYLGGTRFDNPWEESGHTLAETDISAEPSGYSQFTAGLSVVTAIADVVPGTTTLFGCDDLLASEENHSVTYALLVRNSDGDVSDCVVFGHDPDSLLAGTVDGLNPPVWVDDACRILD